MQVTRARIRAVRIEPDEKAKALKALHVTKARIRAVRIEPDDKAKALKALQVIPGIGKSIALDLYNIGIKSPEDLRGKAPEILYEQSNALVRMKQDPCLLYTFRCATYFAETKSPEKKKLNWWYWKNNKK